MSKILVWETLSQLGGGQLMTLKIIDILRKNNEIFVLVPTKGELTNELDKRNIGYSLMGDQSLPKGTKGIKGLIKYALISLSAVRKGRKIARSFNPDYIYAPGPASLPWSALCAKKGVKVIWHLHHIFESGATKKLINIFSAKRCVRSIIYVSDCISTQITQEKAQDKKVTIYNPSDFSDGEIIDLRNEYPSLDRELKIAQIGFITKTKNQMLTLDIIKGLNDRNRDVCCAFIGSVRQDDENFKEQLDERIQKLSLDNNIVFTGYRTDVDSIIGTFDVVFVPSLEGFSLVALSAMKAKVPVLSRDETGCSEIVLKSGCGMIFSPHSDIGAVCDALEKAAQYDVSAHEDSVEAFLCECSIEKFEDRIKMIFSD